MIPMASVICTHCGRPHVATIVALRRRPTCPFCGDTGLHAEAIPEPAVQAA